MLARRATFEHPTAGTVGLPLLVPAFSSKGFALRQYGGKKRRSYSEVAYALAEFGRSPQKVVLISAYDLHHGYLSAPGSGANAPHGHLKDVGLVFIDSGGYELSPDYDSTEPRIYERKPKPFGIQDYHRTLHSLTSRPIHPPYVISNYDFRKDRISFEQQVKEARKTFARYPDCATDFIIKPWRRVYVEPDDLSDSDAGNLRAFDIIGVTEKELGRNLLDKLSRVARLRAKLDKLGINAPIHVWGGLDPLSSPLFFFAGAQVVDGVSWLRYAYRNGLALLRETYCVINESLGIAVANVLNHSYASTDNLIALQHMSLALTQWVDSGGKDFTKFPAEIRTALSSAYAVMCAEIPALGPVVRARRSRAAGGA